MKEIRVDIKDLKLLAETIGDAPRVQIGIFGDRNARQDSQAATNAEIGMAHEFGDATKRLPARSFLRMPIGTRGKEIMAQMKGVLERAIEIGNKAYFWEQLGKSAENIVQQAFDTGGFGQWAPLSRKTLMARERIGQIGGKRLQDALRRIADQLSGVENSHSILVDTGQLRRSVMWRVVKA